MQYLLLIYFALNFSFCNNQKSTKEIVINNYKYTKNDTIIKEIPLNKYGGFFYLYQEIKELTKTLSLVNIEQGFDSMEIRVWFPEMVTSRLLIIKKLPEKWNAIIYTFNYDYNVIKGIDSIVNINKLEVQPKSGWQIFSTKLFEFGITSLPHCQNIPEYPGGGADGEVYSIEIATVDKYRFYSYFDPKRNKKIEQARKFIETIELLKNEFRLEGY